MSRIAYNEYDHACNKAYNENMRKDSSVCETRYPLLMLHGVGFRDLKYINYWGRIPKNLIKNGATVYYGHQEALGTIESNGQMVRNKIIEIIQKTGAEKVNIIAHSKGGLDARHTITTLEMGEYVASLTTISTPHRGSALADFGNKRFSDKTFRSVAAIFDKYFLKIGDKNPDFYTAMHQFTEEYAEKFNNETPDVSDVYYQSYMSLMKNCFSHSLLSIPYLIMCFNNKKNDGLVSLESAQWGDFRGVFSNKRRRGISHGDMIDIARGNYKGFDVVETYINIVSDLKNRGF
jgi:triacylglycerol lipase